jgi:enterobactin synthetase component D
VSTQHCAGLGIDSEEIVDADGLRDIRDVCCSSAERERLFDGRYDERNASAIFSVKESFYKAIHHKVRRFVDFEEVEICAIERYDGYECVQLRPAASSPLSATCGTIDATFVATTTTVHSVVALSS